MTSQRSTVATMTFELFEAESLAKGFDEVLVREWPAGQVVPEHRHDFGVDALVVRGEMWLQAGGTTRHLRPGDRFSLESNEPHAERYGDEGAVYWAARRGGASSQRVVRIRSGT